jgi:4-amino-4-deoxy-L-arabinose transferase-like glycosyltransferase
MLRAPAPWQAVVYGLIALIACAGAFAGLSASSLWIDELFTVYLVHHNGGLGEVLHRALTDTHPPLYYFCLYAWTRLAGFSEAALRLPSAIFAVASIVIFALGTRRVLSRPAIAFACAVAAVSEFWFEQSQNTRSYALCLAVAAALLSAALAFRRRVLSRATFPFAHWMGLSLLGLIGSLTHAYLLLATGMVLLFLLLSMPSWRIRAALIATGLVILACNVAYYRLMIHSSQQDLQNLWFSNNVGFFKQQIRLAFYGLMQRQVIIVTTLLILFGIRQKVVGEACFTHDELHTRWANALVVFVLAGVIACGIGVSLAVAPSFSDRNLLTCVPFAWLLVGRLYDIAGPRGYTRSSVVIAVLGMLMVGSYLCWLPGRELPRRENWRASAQYVSQLPGCTGQLVPAILPYRFGHASPYFRTLAAHDFFGYYMPPGTSIQAYMPGELAARHPVEELPPLLASRAANADTGGCTLLAWGIHDLDESSALKVALDLARQPGVAPRQVLMQQFITYQTRGLRWNDVPDGYVYLAIPKTVFAARNASPAMPVAHLNKENAKALGDRIVVQYLFTYTNPTQPVYQVDVYAIQRWSKQHTVRQDFLAVHRLTCDAPVTKSNWDVWPDPAYPGCSNLPPPTSAGNVNGQL